MSSNIEVSCDIVKEAAQKCIDGIINHRQEVFLAEVEEVKNSWWSKLFRKNWSQELFEAYTERTSHSYSWTMLHGRQYDYCKDLLSLCELSSSGFVWLDEDGASLVNHWRNK